MGARGRKGGRRRTAIASEGGRPAGLTARLDIVRERGSSITHTDRRKRAASIAAGRRGSDAGR